MANRVCQEKSSWSGADLLREVRQVQSTVKVVNITVVDAAPDNRGVQKAKVIPQLQFINKLGSDTLGVAGRGPSTGTPSWSSSAMPDPTVAIRRVHRCQHNPVKNSVALAEICDVVWRSARLFP